MTAEANPVSGAPAPNRSRKTAALWVGGGLIALLAGLVLVVAHDQSVPLCDDARATEALHAAINNGPVAKTLHLSVVKSTDHEEIGWNPETRRRECTATVLLNSTDRVPVTYLMEGQSDSTPLITVNFSQD